MEYQEDALRTYQVELEWHLDEYEDKGGDEDGEGGVGDEGILGWLEGLGEVSPARAVLVALAEFSLAAT